MTHFRPICLITDRRYLAHDTGGGEHPEIPDRLLAVQERLRTGPLAPHLTSSKPYMADHRWLTTGHKEAYLFRLEEAALSGRTYIDHPDNQISYESYDIAQLAAGGGLAGVDRIESGQAELVFCCVRPPGHHAEQAMALGFCLLNNAVIAARYWQQQYGRRKIMIIDWDAHHGNGIQAAFEEDPEVFYISIHEHPTFSFPGTGFAEESGTGLGKGSILNIPLPPGADDGMVLKAFDSQIKPAAERFQPETLIVAAGFDGHHLDDMSGLAYSTRLYHQLGVLMADLSRQYCQAKALTLLEGGYHLEALSAGVEQYLIGLSGGGSC